MTPPPPLAAGRMLAVVVAALVVLLAPTAPAGAAELPEDPPIRIGFGGVYKLGCWTPLDVKLGGASGRCEVATFDADGVATKYSRPYDVPNRSGGWLRFFIRIGQEQAPLTVRVIDDAGNVKASRTLVPRADADMRSLGIGLPATARLLVTFGLESGLADLLREQRSGVAEGVPQVAQLQLADDLPAEWFGYDGVEAVVLGASQPECFRDLSADDPRVAALARWVERGGQLVVFWGAEAPQLFADGGPLATFLPGKFTGEFAPLIDYKAIEVFSNAEVAITRVGPRLSVPQLAEVRGRVLADGGRAGGELPLVVRQRRGLGEITFVAVDPDAPPIDGWTERPSLLRQALGWPTIASAKTAEAARGDATARADSDLANVLTTALSRQFVGVSAAPFALVAFLVLAYVALIGPGDYFFLKRLNRFELTWITFPAIVVATSAAAWWFAYRQKGDELRVNQLEVVDVDATTGQARGTVWTQLFSPAIERYDLALEPRFAASSLPPPASPLESPQHLVSWFGSAGYGLGGMRGQRGGASLFEPGYAMAPGLDAMHGLPVEQWSTKALAAVWTATLDAPLEARLVALSDDLVAGRIENRTGVPLDECLLIHGRWAYRLEPLPPGGVANVDEGESPRTIRTTLASVAAGDDPNVRTAEDGSVLFDPAASDVARIAKMMMFYDAVGGAAYVRVPHRHQAFIDMSRLVRGDQAVLLARAPASAASQWRDGDRPLASDADRRWVYYRFVIPLEEPPDADHDARPAFGPPPLPGP